MQKKREKMRKWLIILLFLIVLLILIVKKSSGVDLYENFTFNPSLSNVTYRMNQTFYGLTKLEVNETCLTLNSTVWCNQSTSALTINLPSGLVSEIVPEEEPEEEPEAGTVSGTSAIGARGGGCPADQNKKCYFVNENAECVEGCQEGYVCNQAYRCVLEENRIIDTVFYFITLSVSKDKYKRDENVYMNVTIANKKRVPDKNGILTTYLLSPSNIPYYFEQYRFEQICPVCLIGEYDQFEDKCVGENRTYLNSSTCNSTSYPYKLEIKRTIAFDKNSTIGEWVAYSSFESDEQELVRLYSRFKLSSYINLLWVLIPLPILVAFATVKYRKKKRLKKYENESTQLPEETS